MSGARGPAHDRPQQANPAPGPAVQRTGRPAQEAAGPWRERGAWDELVDWDADCVLERDWRGTEPDEQEVQAVLLLAGAGLLDGLDVRLPGNGQPLAAAA